MYCTPHTCLIRTGDQPCLGSICLIREIFPHGAVSIILSVLCTKYNIVIFGTFCGCHFFVILEWDSWKISPCQFPVTAVLFAFLYFHFMTSKFSLISFLLQKFTLWSLPWDQLCLDSVCLIREIFPHSAVPIMLYVLCTKYEQYCIMDVFCGCSFFF